MWEFVSEIVEIDPVFGWITRVSLGVLFASAFAHKLRDIDRFAAILQGYRLLPLRLTRPAAIAVAAAEAATAGMLAVPALDPLGSAAALLLLAVYCAAIGVNLARGRRDIDCGCLGPANRQRISPWLLIRNGVLAVGAAIVLADAGARALTGIDAVSIVAGVGVIALIWQAVHQLGAVRATRSSDPLRARGRLA